MTDGPEKIRGTVLAIVFYAEDTGYTVADIDGDMQFTAVGTMPKLSEGDDVTLLGEWDTHLLYGEQFRVRSLEKHEPQGVDAVLHFLSSGAVIGIGPALAKRLTDRFGEQTLDVLRTKPRQAATIKGISRAKAERIKEQLAEQEAEQELGLLLMPAGISYNRVRRIHKVLGIGATEAVRQDPWIIMRLVSGIGFDTANKVAETLGFSADYPARIRSAYWQLLYDALGRGHTHADKKALMKNLSTRLQIDDEPVNAALADGMAGVRKDLVNGKEICSFTHIHDMEFESARLVLQKLKMEVRRQVVTKTDAADYAASMQMPLSDEQIQAVIMGLNHGFSVITGGPGTGKTTIVRVLVGVAKKNGMRVALAAPTGRAARRLAEASGETALTLHRLLSIQFDDDAFPKHFEVSSTIKADLLIVDECSMVDLPLFWRTMAALSPQTSLLLVGDADQLPSVGPGQILRDLLSVEDVVRTKLMKIYRQSEDNLIAINAHKLNRGDDLLYPQKIESPFLVSFLNSDEDMVTTLERLLTGPVRQHYGINDLRDVQILAPLKRGVAGVNNINKRIQTLYQGGDKQGLVFGSTMFCRGDKVIQTRNNYDLLWRNDLTGKSGRGVMNGETGIITNVDKDGAQVSVLFENERTVLLTRDDLIDLELAYAITIHKSQGSEYETVCLMLTHAPPDFLTKNLIYTAFTRAKTRLILIGKKRAFDRVQRAGRVATRRTRLAEFLQPS